MQEQIAEARGQDAVVGEDESDSDSEEEEVSVPFKGTFHSV